MNSLEVSSHPISFYASVMARLYLSVPPLPHIQSGDDGMGSSYDAFICLCNYYIFYKATFADPACLLIAAQKRLRELKSKISSQSKKNFVLERDVRYLDSRIALLIANVSNGH